MVWRHCRRKLLLITPITYKLVTLNPKLKSTRGAGRFIGFPVGGMPTASNSLKDFSKSQDAVALQQIKERGALPMIDHWWYPSGNRPLQQYLGFTAGRWCGWFEHKLTAWLQNSKKRAERSERLMYEQSHCDYLRSGYLRHRLPVMGC